MSTDPRPLRDPWFHLVRGALPPSSPGDDGAFPGSPDAMEAAVALVLRAGSDPHLLLILRAESEGDPWSGHVAFPGGRRDPGDPSLLHTAVRETAEETGLTLDTAADPLGELPPVVPASRRLPPLTIFPFVFGVPQGVGARAASSEVEEVFWVPLSLFHDPDARGTLELEVGGEPRSYPCFRVRGRVVWGLTYRILTSLLERLPEPFALPARGD